MITTKTDSCHNKNYLRCLILIAVITSAAASFASPAILRSFVLFQKDDNDRRRCIGRCDEVLPIHSSDDDDVVIVMPSKKRKFPHTGYMNEVGMIHKTTRRAFTFPSGDPTTTTSAENKILDLRLISSGSGGDGLGSSIWPSGIALASLLSGDFAAKMKGKRVLELGSGCGLPSLVARQICGADKVLATDYWEKEEGNDAEEGGVVSSVPPSPGGLFGANLAYNLGSQSEVRRLDWHDTTNIMSAAQEFQPDIVIGSDLVYEPSGMAPLLQTLDILLKCSAREVLLISPLGTERQALPDFISRLKTDGDFCVEFEELEMVENEGDDCYRLLYMHITK